MTFFFLFATRSPLISDYFDMVNTAGDRDQTAAMERLRVAQLSSSKRILRRSIHDQIFSAPMLAVGIFLQRPSPIDKTLGSTAARNTASSRLFFHS